MTRLKADAVEDAVEAVEDAVEDAAVEPVKRLTTEDLSNLPDTAEEDGPEAQELTADTMAEAAETATHTPDDVASEEESGSESSETPVASDQSEDTNETPEPLEQDHRPEIVPAVAAAAPAKRRSAWPMIIAGLLLAGLGYLAGRGDLVNEYLPESWRAPDEIAPLKAEIAQLREIIDGRAGLPDDIAALGGSIASLGDKVDSIEFPEPDLSPLENGLGEVRSDLQAIGTRVGDIEALMAAAADEPDYAAAFAGLRQESENQQARLDDLIAEAEAARLQAIEDAEAAKAAVIEEAERAKAAADLAAKTTVAEAAILHLQAAVDAGEPFSQPLAELTGTGLAEIPEALSSYAEDGLVTLTALQTDVAGAARNALQAARAQTGAAGSVGGFLEKQLGLRSTEPREGDDPDAVLSRVEALIRAGDIAGALGEAESLPEPAQTAMSDWLSGAKARLDAVTALDAIAASLPTN